MLKLKYLNDSKEYPIEDVVKTSNIITITGKVPVKEVGFEIEKPTGRNRIMKYHDFTTCYRVIENGIQYSNDGSRYEEPEPEIEEPTQDEMAEGEA